MVWGEGFTGWLRQNQPEHLRLGRLGERAAKRHLKQAGLKFLYANFKGEQGEIDLVFREGKVLVFVEVKARSSESWARPAASGSSVCPSPDFWASSQVRRPFEPCFPPPRTRPAAAPARLRAALPGPPAAITTTPALAALRRPFSPFSPAHRPLVHRFCTLRVPCVQAS